MASVEIVAREQWLAAESRVARALHAAGGLQAVLDTACAAAVTELGASHAVVFLDTRVMCSPGTPDLLLIAGSALEPGALTMQIIDLHAVPALSPFVPHAQRAGVAALIDLPLAAHGCGLGHWTLFYAAGRAAGAAELDTLAACAEHLALAIENALRLHELSERTRRLALTYEVSRGLSGRLDLGQVLRGILERCVHGVHADSGSLAAFDASGRALSAWEFQDELLLETPLVRIEHMVKQGLAGWVLRRREPALIPDTSRDPRWLHKPGAAPRSVLCLPLLYADEVVGVMTLSHPQVNAFSRDDLELLEAVADQAALAVQNARLYRAAEARARHLATLNEVSRTLASTLDLDSVLDLIMSKALELLDAEAGSLVLVEGPQRDLAFRVTRGAHAEQVAGLRLPWGTGLTGQVAAEGVPIISNDVRSDPRWFGRTDDAGFVRSILIVPLLSRGTAIGVVTAINKRGGAGFTRQDVELIRSFTDQAAIAVENARLFRSTDQALAARVDELSALETITREIASSLELQDVIDVLLVRALAVTRAPRGLVALAREGATRAVAWRGLPADSTLEACPLARIAVDSVVRAGQAMLLGDVEELYAGDEPAAGREPAAAGKRSRALLCVPILGDRRVLGAIHLEADEVDALNESHASFLAQLAQHAALAIRNAGLFTEVSHVRDRLQAVLNSVRDGIAMFDASGTLLLANPALCTLTGLDLDSFTGPEAAERLSFDDLHRRLGLPGFTLADIDLQLQSDAQAIVRRAIQLAEPRRHVEELIVRVTSTPQPDPGDAAHPSRAPLLLVWHDVTKQQELERTRDEFTHMLVHDLRSPLSAVIGGLSVVQELLKDPETLEPALLQETVDLVLDGARRLLDLINSILDISRLESGRLVLDLMPVALEEIVQDALHTLRSTARSGAIELISTVPPDLPPVTVDRDTIQRVITNLVANALKFSPQGKHITVAASAADRQIVLSVTDEGPGVPVEYHERIFEKFAQAPSTRGRHRGHGLGLYFCKLAVEAHGGRIKVECPESGGSVFSFTLPQTEAQGD